MGYRKTVYVCGVRGRGPSWGWVMVLVTQRPHVKRKVKKKVVRAPRYQVRGNDPGTTR